MTIARINRDIPAVLLDIPANPESPSL